MSKDSAILDWTGSPYKTNGHARRDLFQYGVAQKQDKKKLKARYDAAQDTDTYSNWWAAADNLDADSANSLEVRRKLVSRSRYEVENNGFMAGMVQTHANYLVGISPTLRMQTGNEQFNRIVELIWFQWCKAVNLRRKLWCMAHAKVQDGEAFGILVSNDKLNTRIKLDIRLIETEQVQSTDILSLLEDNHIDGIAFDENGNVEYYDVLPSHPGSAVGMFFSASQRVLSQFMLHWFTQRRPGQHRGVPELVSTLNCGASSRRFREAVIAAAEAAASLGAIMLKTGFLPSEVDQVAPLSTMDYDKGIMTALPQGWDAFQVKPENPSQTYESFMRLLINETARPKSMPYNVAACDSAQYNYASGRLDHQTYFSAIDVEREECNELVLDKLFDNWWSEAVLEYNWDIPEGARVPSHVWDWPKHPVADVKSESLSGDTDLKNGSLTLYRRYSDRGLDAEDEFQKEADLLGIPVADFKLRILDALYPQKPAGPPGTALGDAITQEAQNANA